MPLPLPSRPVAEGETGHLTDHDLLTAALEEAQDLLTGGTTVTAWDQVLDYPGTTLTGTTTVTGTWDTVGGVIRQTVVGSNPGRLRFDSKLVQAMFVLEAEIRMTSVTASDQRAGLLLAWDGASAGSIAARLHMTSGTADALQIETDATTAKNAQAGNWGGLNVWKKLRVYVAGSMATLAVDDVIIFTAGTVQQLAAPTYCGLFAGNCTAEFRNIKAWQPNPTKILSGLPGPVGPQPWTAPTAWAMGTPYTAIAPASAVTYLGETYVANTSHTSTGEFDPTKWTKVAAKGADGADTGGTHIVGVGTGKITTGSSFPSSPTVGDIFIQRT